MLNQEGGKVRACLRNVIGMMSILDLIWQWLNELASEYGLDNKLKVYGSIFETYHVEVQDDTTFFQWEVKPGIKGQTVNL